MRLLSRTIGADRIVDELYMSFKHSQSMPWILPGVPATNKQVEVIIVSIVSIRGGKLYSEHVYWDQASVLLQVGLLDPKLVPKEIQGQGVNQLPIVGREAARRILDGFDEKHMNKLVPRWDSAKEREQSGREVQAEGEERAHETGEEDEVDGEDEANGKEEEASDDVDEVNDEDDEASKGDDEASGQEENPIEQKEKVGSENEKVDEKQPAETERAGERGREEEVVPEPDATEQKSEAKTEHDRAEE
jgi:hypothetical protein